MQALACPACAGKLREGSQWTCGHCGASYRSLRGIPDLRVAEDGFLSNEEDWEQAVRLDAEFDRLDFRGLLECYFELQTELPIDRRRRQVAHILTATSRASQWLASLELKDAEDGPLLDLGCGPGGFLEAAAGLDSERPLWGLDIAMRWLILARKRLDERGLSEIQLVCGCAEALPFLSDTFAGIVAGDLIEHVADQSKMLAESHRVLKPGSRIILAAPNRYSLAPEPHVGVWGVGFLPRSWMSPYVRLVRGLDFRAIRTLSFGEWKRLLASSPFRGGLITAPNLPSEELAHFSYPKRALAQLYNRIVENPIGQGLAKRLGPLLHIVCDREKRL